MEIQYNSIWFLGHSHRFTDWFDEMTFDWGSGIELLVAHCPDHFHIWFGYMSQTQKTYSYKELIKLYPDKYDSWKMPTMHGDMTVLILLCKYCDNYFDKWFDLNFIDFDGPLELEIRRFISKCNYS